MLSLRHLQLGNSSFQDGGEKTAEAREDDYCSLGSKVGWKESSGERARVLCY